MNSRDQLLDLYLGEVGRVKSSSDLITTNLRYVITYAKQYRYPGCDYLELIQAGNLGLVEAVTKYDPTRGVPLVAYARYWIQVRILESLRKWKPQIFDYIPEVSELLSPEYEAQWIQLVQLLEERLPEFTSRLDEVDRSILEKRLLSEEPLTLADLGKQFGMSRQAVEQRQKLVINQLRTRLEI